jgi:hypothetical protein
VSWPLGLRILAPAPESERLRRQVDGLVRLTAVQVVYGQVNPNTLDAAIRATTQLRTLLRQSGRDAMAEHTFHEAGQFLDRLHTNLRSFKK